MSISLVAAISLAPGQSLFDAKPTMIETTNRGSTCGKYWKDTAFPPHRIRGKARGRKRLLLTVQKTE